MPDDLVFTVTGSTASPAQPVTLADAGLRERRDLQEWVLANPGILGDDLAIVTFEFDRWWASSAAPADRLDVLALGKDGRLVVVELKRDRAPDTVEMQAVKYAAMASRFTPETLASQHARFLTQRGTPTSEDDAMQLLVAHAGELDVESLRRPKIAIVAGDFPPVVTATAVWLTEMGLELTLIRVAAYKTERETLITVSQLYPVKDIEEFTVSPRQAEVKAVEEKRQRQRDATTSSRLVAASALEDGTVLHLRPEGINTDLRAAIAAWIEADPNRGMATWLNDSAAPLIWRADEQHYSPSGLAGRILREAAGVSRSIRGPRWWITDEGRDLYEVVLDYGTERERLYFEFWTRFMETVRETHPDWLTANSQPSERSWVNMSSPVSGAYFTAAFARAHRIKVEFYVDSGDQKRNAQVMGDVMARRQLVEESFGGTVAWNPPDENHQYGSVVATADGDVTESQRHDEFIAWFIGSSEKLRAAIHVAMAADKA